MKRVVQINSVSGIGSTGRIAEQIGRLAIKAGWESHIAFGREGIPSKSQTFRIGGKIDNYMHFLQSRLFDRQGLASKSATRHFISYLGGIKPDIVHIHNAHGHYLNYKLLLDYLSNKAIPTILTLHDFWWLTGHCAYIHPECDKWKNGCKACGMLYEYPSSMFDFSKRNWELKVRLLANRGNVTLVPVSFWLERFVKQSALKEVPTKVIENGIDLHAFDARNATNDFDYLFCSDKFSILSVATRWNEANGYPSLLKLAEKLPADFQLIIVGVNEKQLKSLPPKAIGIRRTENLAQLCELYAKSDVLLNPNLNMTFGLVNAESMACGTPAIILKNTAGEEIVEDTGFVVDKVEDVLDLLPDIRGIRGKDIRSHCRAIIQQKYEYKNQYSKYISLYEEMSR
ncbi:MAG: glycosyltransferase [Bacteroidales bacterium]|nr:glycosyltransferase [Bacteroidales bacterium]